jgi:hypothetical protein
MNTTIDLTEFGAIVAAILVLGAIFKNAFPSFPNRLIPLLTWGVAVIAYLVSSDGWADPKQWLAAAIAAATATGIHSGVKNTMQSDSTTTPPTAPPAGTAASIVLAFLLLPALVGCGGRPTTVGINTDADQNISGTITHEINDHATVGVSGTGNPQTGEWTAGVVVTFKETPPPVAQWALEAAGALKTRSGTVYLLASADWDNPEVRNALVESIKAGATLSPLEH